MNNATPVVVGLIGVVVGMLIAVGIGLGTETSMDNKHFQKLCSDATGHYVVATDSTTGSPRTRVCRSNGPDVHVIFSESYN